MLHHSRRSCFRQTSPGRPGGAVDGIKEITAVAALHHHDHRLRFVEELDERDDVGMIQRQVGLNLPMRPQEVLKVARLQLRLAHDLRSQLIGATLRRHATPNTSEAPLSDGPVSDEAVASTERCAWCVSINLRSGRHSSIQLRGEILVRKTLGGGTPADIKGFCHDGARPLAVLHQFGEDNLTIWTLLPLRANDIAVADYILVLQDHAILDHDGLARRPAGQIFHRGVQRQPIGRTPIAQLATITNDTNVEARPNVVARHAEEQERCRDIVDEASAVEGAGRGHFGTVVARRAALRRSMHLLPNRDSPLGSVPLPAGIGGRELIRHQECVELVADQNDVVKISLCLCALWACLRERLDVSLELVHTFDQADEASIDARRRVIRLIQRRLSRCVGASPVAVPGEKCSSQLFYVSVAKHALLLESQSQCSTPVAVLH
mmetsp:Transcript_18334/g.50914  ORF Transcript_18334/g.50914 Transcript_18334/m.50914 type:complete len:435 (+) Transcript_18334:783-2087(+)